MNVALSRVSPEAIKGLTYRRTAFYLNSGRLLWCDTAHPLCSSSSDVLERFSYVLPDHVSCSRDVDPQRSVSFSVDFYGGHGIGRNGGSGRAAIIDGVQLKGIGATELVAGYGDPDHIAGELNIFDAIYEAAIAASISSLLPSGVVPVLGLILTGKETAFAPSRDQGRRLCPGAILIREARLRPAHFMTAFNFVPPKELGDELQSVRLGRASADFVSRVEEICSADLWLYCAVDHAARQMAFANVRRVSHGVISPSNLALDGAWLDLSNVSFVGADVDIASHPDLISFDEERFAVGRYLAQLADNLGAYAKADISGVEVFERYCKLLEGYRRYFFADVVGCESVAQFSDRKATEFRSIYASYVDVFDRPKEKVGASVTSLGSSDLQYRFLIDLFRCSGSARQGVSECHGDFLTFIGRIADRLGVAKDRVRRFAFIRAARKALFRGAFVRGSLLTHIYGEVSRDLESAAQQIIDEASELSRNLRSEISDECAVIVHIHNISIIYSMKDDNFQYRFGLQRGVTFDKHVVRKLASELMPDNLLGWNIRGCVLQMIDDLP